jgi:uncharacterized protein (DUF433 family)
MPTSASWISKKPRRSGGEACVRDTRIPVWSLVSFRRKGASDDRILEAYPSLTAADLEAAFAYATENPVEIERAIWLNDAVMIDRARKGLPAAVVRRGRELRLSDDDIREAFEPPLSQDELRAALSTAR